MSRKTFKDLLTPADPQAALNNNALHLQRHFLSHDHSPSSSRTSAEAQEAPGGTSPGPRREREDLEELLAGHVISELRQEVHICQLPAKPVTAGK